MTEELRLRANGLQFRALAAGPEDGPPVLLLHGFPEGAESWLPQLEALAGAGLRAVAPDLRGYGGTDMPEGEAAYGIDALLADVRGLVEAIGSPAHLAGHDWGALIGWVFAGGHPMLVRSWAALSVGHPNATAKAVAESQEQREASAYIRLFRKAGKAEQVLSENGFQRLRAIFGASLPQRIVDRYLEGLERPGRLTAALNYYRTALPQLALAARDVRVPTRLIWGDRDAALRRLQADLTARCVSGPYDLHVLDGAGHWLQHERPDEVSELLLALCQQGADR